MREKNDVSLQCTVSAMRQQHWKGTQLIRERAQKEGSQCREDVLLTTSLQEKAYGKKMGGYMRQQNQRFRNYL